MSHKPPFRITYRHAGEERVFALDAPADWTAAEAHAASIRRSAELSGSDYSVVTGNSLTLPVDHVLVRLVVWWRNRRGVRG
jgi:acetyl/propionyl-CoA carboxylase alpha subunit